MEPASHFGVRVSYWLLLVIAPPVAIFLLLGGSVKNGSFCAGVFVILIWLGEFGFRRWKRLWGD
jgi:hypothetical protein